MLHLGRTNVVILFAHTDKIELLIRHRHEPGVTSKSNDFPTKLSLTKKNPNIIIGHGFFKFVYYSKDE